MNYRNETFREMENFSKDYTVGDVLFAAFQKEAVKHGISLDFLRRISDEDAYTLVENAKEIEAKETAVTEEYLTNWINK
jgi:hypothetical protein